MSSDPTKSPTEKPEVRAGEWTDQRKPARRRFPHGPASGTALRAAFTREAFADIAQHAKESLRAEICGVLVGETCEDDDGGWVDVRANIRGATASQGASHVTFTQETWTRIHQERETRHPKLRIVGWYHSHPGFGVEFSEMDTFIHRNFFAAPAQLALVSDPVSGQDAACVNTPDGIRYLDRLWVDGRERALVRPASAAPATAPGIAAPPGRIEALEARIGQLLASLDDIHERVSRFYLVVGMVAVMALVLTVAYSIWASYTSRYQPPRALNQFSMPLKLGDREVMVRLEVVGWDVPPELNSIMLQLARERLAAEEARIAAERERAAERDKAAEKERGKQPSAKPPIAPSPGATP